MHGKSDGGLQQRSEFRERVYGESKLSLKEQLLYIRHLLKLFRYKAPENVAFFHRLKKDLSRLALPSLQQAVEQDPKNARYHFHLGMADFKACDWIKAKASPEAALKLDPGFDDAAEAGKTLAGLR